MGMIALRSRIENMMTEMDMSAFEAGVAVREITPPPGAPLWGYSERKTMATGTLDPLYAKALALRAESKTVAVVSLDLGRVPLAAACARIRERAAGRGVDYVFITATHTHHAPVMELEDAPYVADIESKIGDAIEEAVERLQPAHLGIRTTTIDVAHNRRKILADGRCFMIWRNEARVPTSPVDREATLVKIATCSGEPIATLVHFACHPVVMGPSNMQYSADYVGELARLVKESTGAECVFLQGACGNINPYLDKTHIDHNAVEAMRSVGKTCAEAALAAWNTIEPIAPPHPGIAFSETQVEVGSRWDVSRPETLDVLRAVHGDMFDFYIGGARADLTVPLNTLVIHRDLALAGMPGEIFVQYQLALKAGPPLPRTLLCGYTGDYFAYFPPVRDALAGGYGGTAASYVGLGAGDKLAVAAQIEIARLAGLAHDVCTPADFAMQEEGPIPE